MGFGSIFAALGGGVGQGLSTYADNLQKYRFAELAQKRQDARYASALQMQQSKTDGKAKANLADLIAYLSPMDSMSTDMTAQPMGAIPDVPPEYQVPENMGPNPVTGKTPSLYGSNLPQRAVPYIGMMDRAAYNNQLPPELLAGLIQQESGFNTKAVSKKGAAGLTQVIPSTGKDLGLQDPFNPEQSINAGAKYLGDLLKQYNGDERLALAGYNAGPGAVNKYKGVPPYAETKGYLASVLANAAKYQPPIQQPSTPVEASGYASPSYGDSNPNAVYLTGNQPKANNEFAISENQKNAALKTVESIYGPAPIPISEFKKQYDKQEREYIAALAKNGKTNVEVSDLTKAKKDAVAEHDRLIREYNQEVLKLIGLGISTGKANSSIANTEFDNNTSQQNYNQRGYQFGVTSDQNQQRINNQAENNEVGRNIQLENLKLAKENLLLNYQKNGMTPPAAPVARREKTPEEKKAILDAFRAFGDKYGKL